jgi:hypothetical protein
LGLPAVTDVIQFLLQLPVRREALKVAYTSYASNLILRCCSPHADTWSDNKDRELIAEYHCSHPQNTPLRKLCTDACAFKTILELVLWNVLQSCRRIIPYVISVIKMPSFQYFLYLPQQKKSMGARSGE